MLTGFFHGFGWKPLNKNYKYHGERRRCNTGAFPNLYDVRETDVPYGPTQGMNFYNTFNRGYYHTANDYLEAWNAFEGTPYVPYVGQHYVYFYPKNYWSCYRAGFVFDTSGLPSDAKIVSGTLQLAIHKITGYREYDIVVQNGQPIFPHEYDYPGDYWKGHYSGWGGSAYFLKANLINLNETGIKWINKYGKTKFMLRSSTDIRGQITTREETVYYKWGANLHILIVGFKQPL